MSKPLFVSGIMDEFSQAIQKKDIGKIKDEHRADLSGRHILLVEDVVINREIASFILGDVGFQVETAENGEQAVTMVKESQPGYYDLVLMDIQMPVMNGYEAAKAIRALDDKELAKIPVIAMTANAFSEDVQKAHDAGMNGHISKPIDVGSMLKTMSEVLAKAQQKK